VGFTVYKDRFDVDTPFSRAVTFVQIVASANLALHVTGGTGAHAVGFALAFVYTRLILVAQYLHAGYTNPPARELAYRYARGFGIAALIWLLSILVPAPARFGLWLVAIAIDMGTPLPLYRLRTLVPVSLSHVPERFGLFTIIVLGEAVTAVIRNRADLPENPYTNVGGLCGLLMAFCFWWIYYDNLKNEVLRDARITGPIWLYGHILLTIGLLCTSVGTERLLAMMPGLGVPLPVRLAMGLGIATCLVMLGLMHRLVRCPDYAFKARVRYVGAAIILVALPLAGAWRPVVWMAFLAIVMLGQVAAEGRRFAHPIQPLDAP
jgi:low temperature requirement protein LtrA